MITLVLSLSLFLSLSLSMYSEFQGRFRPIYNELRIIDADLLKSEDKLIPVIVMKLLSLKLGVKELQAADVIRLHILPCFQENRVTKVDIN